MVWEAVADVLPAVAVVELVAQAEVEELVVVVAVGVEAEVDDEAYSQAWLADCGVDCSDE